MILLGGSDGLKGAWFIDQAHFGGQYQLDQVPVQYSPLMMQTIHWFDQYFAGQKPNPNILKLAPQVTKFRTKVLNALENVPYGTKITYHELGQMMIADHSKVRSYARAVGVAIGHNPISIIIPCHRVLGKNGELTGYAGGIDRKKWLLKHEGIEYINHGY